MRRCVYLSMALAVAGGVVAAFGQSIIVPLHGAGYLAGQDPNAVPPVPPPPPAGQPADPQPAGGQTQLDRIEAKLDKLLKALEDAPGESKPPDGAASAPDASAKAVGSAMTKCAQCHSTEAATVKGGDFVMFDKADKDGKVRFIVKDGRDLRRIVQKVNSGQMPKPPVTLTPGEKAALVGAIEQVVAGLPKK